MAHSVVVVQSQPCCRRLTRPSFEMFCNLPFKTTIKLVSQTKLLVHLSPLKLDAFLGMVTAIQKKLKPNIA